MRKASAFLAVQDEQWYSAHVVIQVISHQNPARQVAETFYASSQIGTKHIMRASIRVFVLLPLWQIVMLQGIEIAEILRSTDSLPSGNEAIKCDVFVSSSNNTPKVI